MAGLEQAWQIQLSATSSGDVNPSQFVKLALRYLRPYRWIYAAGMVFLMLSTATSLGFVAILGPLVNSAEGKSNFFLTDIDEIALLLGVTSLAGQLLLTLLVGASSPMLSSLELGQNTPLALALLMFALRLWARGSGRLSLGVGVLLYACAWAAKPWRFRLKV